MMTRRSFSQDDFGSDYYFAEQVQPELDNIQNSLARCWWMAKTAVFVTLFIIFMILKAVFHIGVVVVSLLVSLTSLIHSVFTGLRLFSKIALDWLMSRPELQSIHVR